MNPKQISSIILIITIITLHKTLPRLIIPHLRRLINGIIGNMTVMRLQLKWQLQETNLCIELESSLSHLAWSRLPPPVAKPS